MKAIVLARVSDKKQDSNEAQITRLYDYIKFKNLEVLEIVEIEESSTKGDRKKFQEVIKKIEDSKQPIALVVDTVDRLQRSFKESVQLDDLRKVGKIEIHFYRENLIINKDSNSADLLRWDMAVMFARSYVLQLSDNVKRKQEQMLKNGEYPSQPPCGYKRIPNKDDKDKTKIVIDSYNAKIVKKAYELYATGAYSMELVRKKLKEDYGVSWSKGFLDKVLKNSFYCGYMAWKEKVYPHKYELIVSKGLFDKVQELKTSFNKKRRKIDGKLPHMYRGMLRCGHCGLSITPEKHKGIVYYHCTQYNGKHDAKWLTEEDITKQLGQVFKNLQVPEHIMQQILDSLNNVHQGKVEFQKEQYNQLTRRHKEVDTMLDNLYRDKLKGRITDDVYDKFYEEFRTEISEIDTKLSMLQDAEDNYYITAKYLLELANRAYDLFISSEVAERRQLLKLVLSNLTVEGDKVCYDAVKPFDSILVSANSHSWLPLVNMFLNREIDFAINIRNIQGLLPVLIYS